MTPAPMLVWLDMQLPPSLAPWLSEQFAIECVHVRELGHQSSSDRLIFDEARQAGAIVISKDADFARLVVSSGSPPSVIWLRCGNTSRIALQSIFEQTFLQALSLLREGESLVEIQG